MPGALGGGDNRATIYARGGGTQLLTLDAVSALEWGRTRNAFSTAQVTVTADDTNFGQLGDVHTWAHELVIFRDGARVWEGPIRVLDYGRGDTLIMAVDVLGWLAKRRIRLYRTLAEGNEEPVTGEMDLALTRALSPDDPNVLTHRLTLHHAGEAQITRDVKPSGGMADSDFTGMAGQGGNFTTVGRKVIVWPDEVLLGRLDTLIPERDTTADVRVAESGDDLATSVTAVNSGGDFRTVAATSSDVDGAGVSTYYGLHEKLASTDKVRYGAALAAVARSAVAQLFPTPELVSMPSDSQLKPTAPFSMTELVPGVMVPVETDATPRRASGTFILDSVKVTQGASGERVSVTLGNASAYAGVPE